MDLIQKRDKTLRQIERINEYSLNGEIDSDIKLFLPVEYDDEYESEEEDTTDDNLYEFIDFGEDELKEVVEEKKEEQDQTQPIEFPPQKKRKT